MLFLSVLFLNACSDDDAKPADDQFTFAGESYPVNLVQYDGLTSSQTYFHLMFYPNGTHTISLSFPGIDEIPDGVYTFKPIGALDYDPDIHFSGGAFYINPQGQEVPISGGTVRFSEAGDEHKITIDVETPEGRIKGSYTGPLVQI